MIKKKYHQACSIPDAVFKAAGQFAGIPAIEDGSTKIDYAELPEQALAVAASLIHHGIDAGDRVAIWAPNSARWVLAAIGLQMAGAVLVPINTRMKAREAADVLERSGAKALFIVGDFLNVDYPKLIETSCPKSVRLMVQISSRASTEPSETLSWEDFINDSNQDNKEQAHRRAQAVSGSDISDVMFTSGTTGKPKGVMSRHGACIQAFSQYVDIIGLQPGDRYLIVNPFFHAFGYKAGWLSALLAGVTIIPQTVFDADDVFRRIEEEQINVLPGPPTLYLSLLAHPRLAEADLSSLRVAVTGASTIPPVLIERMRNELGFKTVTTAYGLTECGGLTTICLPDDDAETIATTSGKAIANTEVAILDPEGKPLPAGVAGEICLRGFHIMEGYLDNPQATKETIDDNGWLHTGDVGTLDDRGYLRITDRLKDMFINGGFNCYPAEIEATLVTHPAIAQTAVIGVPDERMGEVGCAFIVLKPNHQLESDDVIQWSRNNMANYKVPRHIRFVETLPMNASNKVVKAELANQF
ncbi:FadD3 family acyl-CoA ligase [Endozoicomonas ascidiicola]|uniref:FadD3 family acyl-CoA ligase n=1 Tax=Endozoicomonas ascidiicola TaxID=1698521 RepID=UPI00082DA6E5|nr:FadD3 family acyl-CoA ligase [Endozoicomonas ascidiicola]